MRRTKPLPALLALCLLLSACGGSAGESGMSPDSAAESEMDRGGITETWTLCLCLCGSNLESKQGWASKTI